MELIVDHEPKSVVAKAINLYSRANIKTIELSSQSVHHLNLNLPVLSSKQALRHPLSIYSFLASVSGVESLLLGETPLEKAQTSSWVELANSIPASDFLDHLEKKLLSRTFLVSNHITVADIAAYAVVQKTIGGVTFGEKNKFPCILRWASHLMSLPGLSEAIPFFEVPFKVNKVMETYENLFIQNDEVKNETGKTEAKGKAAPSGKEEGKKQAQGKEEGKKSAQGKEEGKKNQQGKKNEGKKEDSKQKEENKKKQQESKKKQDSQGKGKQKQGAQAKPEELKAEKESIPSEPESVTKISS
jgi:hypothetical protein